MAGIAGFDVVAAVRDRRVGSGPEAGLISNAGITLMGLAGIIAVLGAWKSSRLQLAMLSMFCCFFAIDDALLIHERFGKYEVVFFLFYGFLAIYILYIFWAAQEHLPWPLVVAIGAFVVSVVVDVSWGELVSSLQTSIRTEHILNRVGFIMEDIPKFGGILVLSSFAVGEVVFGS